ncbi:hypothetical protein KIN20_009203 [Parelaphostrongylus tenuis]|uniref:Uncharacterized protein n=1 Tax=Parelaphostrongylus tenuis TaxID=148309 RepID=A0AAD5MQ90_PARTN|nr:hypothetical protein KIN20_009203 [Parelaphostrongylus tenuis]
MTLRSVDLRTNSSIHRMVQGLSNEDLSRLWLLHGRHTTARAEYDESPNLISMNSGIPCNIPHRTTFEDSTSIRSDDSHAPDCLVIVEELNEELEQNESSGSSCVRITSKQLSPCELVSETMDITTERIEADAGMTCFGSDVYSESPATNVKSKSLLVRGKRAAVSRRSSVIPTAPEFSESSKAVTAAVSSKSSKIPAAHEFSNLSKHVEVEEIANGKKQPRHISVSKNGVKQSRGSFGTTSSSVPTSQDRLLGEETRPKRQTSTSTYTSAQIGRPAHQYCPAVDVPTQVGGVDVVGADPLLHAISAPSTDIQSQEYSGSVPVKNDKAVTKRRFRKAFQPENKVAFTPCEASELNVPPVKRSARVHKQVSITESSAEETPLVTPAMVPGHT